MSANLLPVRAYLTRADAEVALRALEASGIRGVDMPFMLLVPPDNLDCCCTRAHE